MNKQYQHREALLEKIGPGAHPCHWCGDEVVWDAPTRPTFDGVLVVDHLDNDHGNNDPVNLVPSCNRCNSSRKLGTTDKPGRLKFCAVPTCERPHYARDLCSQHYKRWLRHGDAEYVREARAPGKVQVTPDGYLTFRGIRAHRLVHYNQVGYGPHRCHWCRRPINWRWDRTSDWTYVLVVDHLDHDRKNNHPSNLVSSCQSCNGRRTRTATMTDRRRKARYAARKRKAPGGPKSAGR